MTDDRKLTSVEWRLYVVALLATIYVITWRVLERPRSGDEVASEDPPPGPAPELTASPRASESPRAQATPIASRPQVPATTQATIAPPAVWLDQLPARNRPALAPPAGWIVVDRRSIARAAATPATPTATPRLVRAPAPAVLRPSTPTLKRAPGTRSIRRVRTRSS